MPCKKVVFCLGILWVCFVAHCFAGVVSSQYMEEHVKNQVENLATKTELNEGLQGKQPVGDYVLKADIPSVPTKVSELTNDSGYVGSSALANKVDVGQVTQTLQGVYTITGAIYVPTPALPTAQ